MFDIKLDKIPWDKVLWIGGGGVVLYFAYQWYQSNQANTAATASAQSQTDAELAQQLLEQPLSNGEQQDSSATVTAPEVDTGNAELQALVDSILNPASTPAATPATTTTTTATSLPSTQGVSLPVSSGAVTQATIPQPILNQSPSTPSSIAASLAANTTGQ